MESTISICDAEISLQTQKINAFTASFSESLHSLLHTVQETARCQVQLDEAKAKLRDTEDDFVKALAVKTRREAKRMALVDAIASTKARVEELDASFREQRTKKQAYAAIISQQSLGVKFTFKNINMNNPHEEYFFTILHGKDTYSLLSCEPSLGKTKELIHELNNTNDLFKFVRVMRKKFQEAVAQGSLVETAGEHEESAFNSTSAPVLSMSSVRSDFPGKENEHQVEPTEGNTKVGKKHVNRRLKAVLSPGSASSVRQSPRLKARKES
ncbi:kinetochore protein SPC25 homolog isoform X3 [Vigna angularis]|uniref:kinetochore protein SPC25 homolog isoform X3 n=1 Tax=Phaseolus angularis TaxID=3914 RepID=UPI0022B5BAC6|nr:kinetochore protein SPC25 homolog isoform X3 [Vigna angularis]